MTFVNVSSPPNVMDLDRGRRPGDFESFKDLLKFTQYFTALMGLSLASIFKVYTGTSIANAFFTTAVAFGAMSLFGYTTKKDLTKRSRLLLYWQFARKNRYTGR